LIGKQLAHFEVLAKIGEGGMGEVYRARDQKLGRDVALKILPRDMSGDPERIARFHREARLLASLQHPHVASIYGFEDLPEARFLVMELVEGEDLAQRMARGPIPVSEAIEIAGQIAQGLEAAHEQSLVHRDLKPANVKLAPDGTVKILDFGLARAYIGEVGDESDLAHSPTITAAMTQTGTILGTAAYMSPEQARGKFVDRRTDVWALGVILFEMLIGRRLFEGETVSDTLAAVLRAEPDFDELPKDTPQNVRRVIQRCLARDPRRRTRSAGDVWLELQDTEVVAEPVVAPRASRSPVLPAAMLILAFAIVFAAWTMRDGGSGASAVVKHLSLALPDGSQFVSRDQAPLGAPQPGVDISRDGRLVVAVIEFEGTTWLYRRFLDEPDGEIIPGTEGAFHPRISPDGSRISFFAGNSLKRVDARGERITPVVEVPNPFGQTWSGNQEILVSRREAAELVRVDVQRNTHELITPEDRMHRFFWVEHVPGTGSVLVNRAHSAKNEEAETDPIFLDALDGSEPVKIGVEGTIPRFAREDLLLFVRDGALMAAPFDLGEPERAGVPETILDGVLVESTIGHFALSGEGTMVYAPGRWQVGKALVWDDGNGNVQELDFPLLGYGDFELSPDGKRLAITVGSASAVIWIYDLERGTRRRLTTEGTGYHAVWSPDGTRIAYATSEGDAHSMLVVTVGSSEPPRVLVTGPNTLLPYAWHEQAGLLYAEWGGPNDIHSMDPEAPEDSRLLVSSGASEWGPDISPDGKWMAYTSDESGRYEIYVRSIGAGGRSWSVSVDGGEEPIWSSDGSAIFFRNGSEFLRTPVLEARDDGSRFRAGAPEVFVSGAYANVPGISYEVGPDDDRLLLLRTDGGTERPGHLNVILNFDEIIDSAFE
jgi:dipeptidyl aminopeptidase/acylaminoacyl peptidase